MKIRETSPPTSPQPLVRPAEHSSRANVSKPDDASQPTAGNETRGESGPTGFFSKLVAPLKKAVANTKEWLEQRGGIAGLLGSLFFGFSSSRAASIVVESDPNHANHLKEEDVIQAQATMRQNAPLEANGLQRLSPQEQQAYKALRTQLAHSTVALGALQSLLIEGKLTSQPLSLDGKSVLQNLADLMAQPLAAGIDRSKILAQVVIEIENPVRVAQHNLQTCGATTAQILLLRENPAEYARIISNLASVRGSAPLAGGETLQRETGWNPHNDPRTISSQLFQSTVMELSSLLDYDPRADRHGLGPLKPMRGLMGGGLRRALEQLTGADYTNYTATIFTRSRIWKRVKEAIAEGRGPVPVAAWWGKNGHFVQIDRIENDRVYYTNPWGREESMTETDFEARLMQAQIRS
ncbi:MAG: hypothetical protein VKN33_05125 [Candidatus Sericytochromatia bacterium]|nr:hypothetical protein [Candidatus Sericytochromatia bacterium]